MAPLRRLVFIEHPHLIFSSLSFATAVAALSPTRAFTPLILLLTSLHLYVRVVAPRPQAFARLANIWFWVTAGACVAHSPSSIHSLSSTAGSLLSLFLFSGLSSFVAMAAMYLDAKVSAQMHTPWARISLFPAVWASVWQGISHINSVGNLLSWTPVVGIDPYKWMRPVVGSWGINWVVAAWAVVGSEIIGAWFIGPGSELEDSEDNLTNVHDEEESGEASVPSLQESHHILFLGIGLLALAIPSYFVQALPDRAYTPSTTPLTVGCVLPPPRAESDHRSPLDRFIAESSQLTRAKVLLWPEGAVHFETATERESAIERVRSHVRGPYIGISFNEPAPADWAGGSSRSGMRRNGLVLVGPEGVVFEYYKQNLVPLVESYSMTPSNESPSIYDLQLGPPSGTKKPDWTPGPPYTRPIPVTAGICLDFAQETLFSELPSRPALILAPAQTWHRDVGLAMWEQARSRAEELNSVALFCDGGEGSVSGIAGHGLSEPMQAGGGSWIRTVGVQWPFDERKTFYTWAGDKAMFALVWAILGVGWIAEIGVIQIAGRLHFFGEGGVFSRLVQVVQSARSRFETKRERVGEEQPLLVDV